MNSQRNGYGTNFQLTAGTLLAYANIAAGLYTSSTEEYVVMTNQQHKYHHDWYQDSCVYLCLGRLGCSPALVP